MAAPDVPPIRIPDEFTVWAASDLHGQLGAVDRLLGAAGLTDGADRWTAPAGTAFVVTGDVVDRGPDSLRLVRRLASLRAQAGQAGTLIGSNRRLEPIELGRERSHEIDLRSATFCRAVTGEDGV